jgi:nitroreductase
METMQAIFARKTIRDFQEKAIPVEMLETLLSAGLKAPSNNHMRQWEFILLQDRQKRIRLLDQLLHPVGENGALGIINTWGLKDEDQRAMYLDAIPKQYAMLAQAACLILPCFNQPSPLLLPKTLSDLNAFASIWMCIENILIAAADVGISGVVRIPMEDEREKLKTLLGIPDAYEIPCFLALGYPAADAHSAKQVQIDLQQKIHLDQW